MSRVEVSYQDQKVGVLVEAQGGIYFQYDPEFIATGHELSPLNLRLGPGLQTRGSSPSKHLPGLFEDSLPDTWGERVMREWFRRRSITRHNVTPLMMLSYVGRRGMGALIYEPQMQDIPTHEHMLLPELYNAAAQAERAGPIDLDLLAQVGTSAGGARPKALIGLSTTGSPDILAGADDLPTDYEAWIVKFDTSREGIVGCMEHAYGLMAAAAGLEVPLHRLLETQHDKTTRRHFAVKRFDRENNQRIHHHTLAGLCHIPGCDLSYEKFLRVTRVITQDEREVWHAYRRAVFNVLASNRDDHGNNHGFLYRNRTWKLGPAYDLTFCSPRQLPERGMSLCGERSELGKRHLLKLASDEGLDAHRAAIIFDEVATVISNWRRFADEAQVPNWMAVEVASVLNAQLKD